MAKKPQVTWEDIELGELNLNSSPLVAPALDQVHVETEEVYPWVNGFFNLEVRFFFLNRMTLIVDEAFKWAA